MKILFCGIIVPARMECQIKDVSVAGNRFQNNMIRNMEALGHDVYGCSYLGIPVSPKARERLKREEQSEKSKVCYVFKGKNILASIIRYYKTILGMMDDMDTIICYNIIYAWILLPCFIKMRKKNGVAIIADYSESNSYRSLARKLYAVLQLWSMRRFETVVGLSANICLKLRKKQRFILMEGGIDQEFYDAFSYQRHKDGQPVNLLYSGLLSPVTGVDILLEAVKKCDRRDIQLLVTGRGPLEELVKKASLEDGRICYRGHLPYEEYMQQLQNADILINPRNMNLPENQNNFPSKIMEYLAVGKPILSTRFVGWEKFEENIIFCESSVDGLEKGIGKVIRELGNDLAIYGKNREKAKQFEWKTQIKKIIS